MEERLAEVEAQALDTANRITELSRSLLEADEKEFEVLSPQLVAYTTMLANLDKTAEMLARFIEPPDQEELPAGRAEKGRTASKAREEGVESGEIQELKGMMREMLEREKANQARINDMMLREKTNQLVNESIARQAGANDIHPYPHLPQLDERSPEKDVTLTVDIMKQFRKFDTLEEVAAKQKEMPKRDYLPRVHVTRINPEGDLLNANFHRRAADWVEAKHAKEKQIAQKAKEQATKMLKEDAEGFEIDEVEKSMSTIYRSLQKPPTVVIRSGESHINPSTIESMLRLPKHVKSLTRVIASNTSLSVGKTFEWGDRAETLLAAMYGKSSFEKKSNAEKQLAALDVPVMLRRMLELIKAAFAMKRMRVDLIEGVELDDAAAYVWPFYVRDRIAQESTIAKLLMQSLLTLSKKDDYSITMVRRAYCMHMLVREATGKAVVGHDSELFKPDYLANGSKAAELFDDILSLEPPKNLARA